MSGYLRNLGRQIAPFALAVIAAASTLFVMIGSLLLAPLILAGFWLNNYLMRDEGVVFG
ncbi:hypothetical protein [Methylococcus mesophilus]|uniref:hypothetical protein n=1 Tax=Methylococcus mesophilus TaxID=2993564 RepID=UPI00224B0FF3|nr:hypothetical protein [Methylococcus mesophilus]UZR28443.1 hypothetical protein OOT43_17245 [Methylococcus mesophilus]